MDSIVDPKLKAALEGANEVALNVFAKFRPEFVTDGSETAATVVRRVSKKTKESPKFNFRDLDSVLHVHAHPAFIRELIRQPEVWVTSMVPSFNSALIKPLNPRDVSESNISVPVYPRRHTTGGSR